MDIVIISTGLRKELLFQTWRSMIDNADHPEKHTYTLVYDGHWPTSIPGKPTPNNVICNLSRQGASASRNIGAGSIPKYRRQKHVMFSDDDCYYCPKWDSLTENTIERISPAIISGHAHPYNLSETKTINGFAIEVPLLISTVHFVMPWFLWDHVGFFKEPGGSGGGEDYDYCMRAKALGAAFAVTVPMSVIHCGLTTSSGREIVGYTLMQQRNAQMIADYGLQGKVRIE